MKHQNILEQFARFAENKGLKRRNILMYKSQKLFETNLYGNIIYNMLGMEAYIEYLNKSDKTVLKALEVLDKGESFPKAPEQPIEPKVSDEGTKKQLRKQIAQEKRRHGITELITKSAALLEKLEQHPKFASARTVCSIIHWMMKYRHMTSLKMAPAENSFAAGSQRR